MTLKALTNNYLPIGKTELFCKLNEISSESCENKPLFCSIFILQMKIEIDPGAGFCFGVQRAIQLAERELHEGRELYSLGQIVHNESEENRLKELGMKTISHDEFGKLRNRSVLIRAHGEPPSTYQTAAENGLHLIEATCPIVTKLQQKIRWVWEEREIDARQIVIVGKKHHPEVKGLAGQTDFQAIVIETLSDIEKIDPEKPVFLFAQTTVSGSFFEEVVDKISQSNQWSGDVTVQRSICNHVKNRKDQMMAFAGERDLVIFVGGKNSSNGQYLFGLCQTANSNSFFIENETLLKPEWFETCKSVGITGATSTPPWLLEKVEQRIKTMINT